MDKIKKPLFSKPILAGIMVLSTLAIWALNSTAPKSPTYPEINLKSWQTKSDIPVVWLTQKAWQKSNMLHIRFSFRAPTKNLALTDATLSLMLDDPLSLISSTINQRLSPLSANVSSYYDHEGQILDITTNNSAQFLTPTLDIIGQWLTQPEFKVRSFDRWQRQSDPDLPSLHSMQTLLFHQNDKNFTTLKKDLSRQEVAEYYQQLTRNVSRITLVGHMDKATEQRVKAKLNSITQSFTPAHTMLKSQGMKITKAASQSHDTIKQHSKPKSTTQTADHSPYGQTQNGMVLAPLRSVKDWISLQIWGADIVRTLRQQTNVAYVQLNLTFSPTQPWAWWRIQYAPHPNSSNTEDDKTHHIMTQKEAIQIGTLPSVVNKKRFESLLSSFKTQLEEKTQSPNWWSKLTGEVTQPYSQISPTQFVDHYQQAIDTFTQEDYQQALQHLFIPSSYQETQVHP